MDGVILRDIQDITMDKNIRESSLVEQMRASTVELAHDEFRYSDFTGSDLSDQQLNSLKVDKTYSMDLFDESGSDYSDTEINSDVEGDSI